MNEQRSSLRTRYSGWDAYQTSLVQAVTPLSAEQLSWRPAPHLRSAGALAQHIAEGRISWFHQFMGEGDAELTRLIADGHPDDSIATSAPELAGWLKRSWPSRWVCRASPSPIWVRTSASQRRRSRTISKLSTCHYLRTTPDER